VLPVWRTARQSSDDVLSRCEARSVSKQAAKGVNEVRMKVSKPYLPL
jgi:hypothetical protein